MAQNGKSVFKDRRFGEGNSSLSAEAKRLARFQRERSRQLKRAAKYNLEAEAASGRLSGTADVLTHGGKVSWLKKHQIYKSLPLLRILLQLQ